MVNDSSEYATVGRISGVFGIKGWVKIQSSTEPEENVFDYRPWRVKLRKEWVELEIDQFQPHNDGWIAHIKGVDDRTEAEQYKLLDIKVCRSEFEELESGEYYWHQLIGLRVIAEQSATVSRDLGVVAEMMETGANDVLVVKADENSFDGNERLIPYVPDMYVKSVDLEKKTIIVDWHIED